MGRLREIFTAGICQSPLSGGVDLARVMAAMKYFLALS